MSHRRSIERTGDTRRRREVANRPGSLWWSAATLLAYAGFAPVLLQAQSGDTLGTKLTLSGETLTFRWEAKHPWNSQMSSAGVQLFAEFKTDRQGRVIQKLDAGRPVSAVENSVTLHLPDGLEAIPSGNVCLYLQVAGGRRIPLRKPRSADADTEHFAVPTWEAAVTANSTSKIEGGRQAALETALASVEAAVQMQAEAIQKKGWTGAASCDAIRPPAFAPSERPADVFPVPEHDAMARRVCIRRVVEGRLALLRGLPEINVLYKLRIAASSLPDPKFGTALLLYLRGQKDVGREDLRLREAEFATYRADWAKWSMLAESDIRENTPPAFGSLKEDLHLQDVTAAVGLEILDFTNLAFPVLHTLPRPPKEDVLGYFGGAMESYSRCVHDGQDELAAKLRAWQEQVERAPMLEQMAKDQLRSQCVNAFAGLESQRQQLVSLQQQLETLRRTRTTPTVPGRAGSDQQNVVLNGAACTVQ